MLGKCIYVSCLWNKKYQNFEWQVLVSVLKCLYHTCSNILLLIIIIIDKMLHSLNNSHTLTHWIA